MVSFVGSQTEFLSAVESLIELEYDAVEAYEASINRLEAENFKNKLMEFKSDHERHVKKLTEIIKKHGGEPPKVPDNTKQWLTKGKVILGSLMGDISILRAMNSNEIDTNSAYERMCLHEKIWEDVTDVMHAFLSDERRHKAWLEENIKII